MMLQFGGIASIFNPAQEKVPFFQLADWHITHSECNSRLGRFEWPSSTGMNGMRSLGVGDEKARQFSSLRDALSALIVIHCLKLAENKQFVYLLLVGSY